VHNSIYFPSREPHPHITALAPACHLCRRVRQCSGRTRFVCSRPLRLALNDGCEWDASLVLSRSAAQQAWRGVNGAVSIHATMDECRVPTCRPRSCTRRGRKGLTVELLSAAVQVWICQTSLRVVLDSWAHASWLRFQRQLGDQRRSGHDALRLPRLALLPGPGTMEALQP
jgi:hypothetical protein